MAARPPASRPPLGTALRGYWREFRSMRTAVVLLFLLAAGAVFGSLFPQRAVSPQRVDQYLQAHPGIAPLLDRLGLFDVFGSPWFMAIYVALLLALVACLVPRVRAYLRLLRSRPPRGGKLPRYRNYAAFEVDGPPEQALAAARRVLARRRFRLHAHAPGELAGEKGYLREGGSLLFHVSFLLLLVGLAYGKGLGYRGQMTLVEGDVAADARINYDSFSAGRFFRLDRLPPFELRLDRFRNGFYPNGTPSEYASWVTALDARTGRQLQQQKITVNRPMTVDGVRVFQSDYGYAPVVRVTGPDGQVLADDPMLTLRDPATEISTGAVKLPMLSPQVGLELTFFTGVEQETGPDGQPLVVNDPRLLNPVLVVDPYRGDLHAERAQSVFTLDHSDLTRMLPAGEPPLLLAPGQSRSLPGGVRVTFAGLKRFSVLTLARDPGVPIVATAAALILLGLLPSLHVTRRRVWLRVTPAQGAEAPGGRTRVELAGHALQGKLAFVDEFDQLVGSVRDALPAESRPKGYAVPGR